MIFQTLNDMAQSVEAYRATKFKHWDNGTVAVQSANAADL
jgi:hypothetical protein